MIKKQLIISFGLIGLLGGATAQAGCSGAACSINTNWDEHSPSRSGWSADLRYSYSRADSLRSGSREIDADTAAEEEVENLRTLTQIVTATLDYTYDENWGAMVSVPYINRDHTHNLGPYVGATSAGYESFSAKALGDIKLVGRYRWTLDKSSHTSMGVKFGLKLNTGKKDFTIEQTGEKPGETSLQPGNGSTDVILGLFWNQSAPGSDWSWFTQGTLQSAASSDATFRPGNQINLDGGTRYALSHSLSALLQLNAQWNGTDSGESAAHTHTGAASSGAKIISLSPGVSYALTRATQLYGMFQVPVYRYVNGEQLTADSSLTAGISHRF